MNDSKPKGWFSRRHETRKEHDEANVRYGTRKERQEDKKIGAAYNADQRAGRTPDMQLAVLDERLGKDKGAVKERDRLVRELGV